MRARSYYIILSSKLLLSGIISRRSAVLCMGMAFCCASFFAAAQRGSFTIRHYTTENGLPQNSVRFAAVDEKGFMWLGSENGITRFDGQHFKVFNMANTKAYVNTDRIRGVFADRKSHVFFSDGGFRTYEVKDYNTIAGIGRRLETEYVISTNNGLIPYGPFLESIKALSPPALQELITRNEYIRYHVYRISDDEEYIGSDSSIAYMKNGMLFKVTAPRQNSLIINDTIYHINEDRSASVFCRDKFLGRQQLLTGDILADKSIAAGRINITEAGSTWLAAAGNNFYSISRQGSYLITRLLFKDIVLPPFENIVYDSKHDQYIICTIADGFYILKAVPFSVVQEQIPPYTKFMNAFASQVLLPGDSIVISRNILFDKYGRQIRTEKDESSIGGGNRTGDYWRGFFSVQKRNARLQPVFEVPNLSKDYGFDIFINDTLNNRVWTYWEHNLNFISEQEKKIQTVPVKEFEKQKINFIAVKSRGEIWVGTDSGLNILTLSNLRLRRIANSDGKTVRRILPDPENDIYWTGTYGSGPCYIQNDTLKQLPADRSGNLAYTHYFFEDKKGFMWIPTNNGLYMASKKDLLAYVRNQNYPVYYQYFDKEDGFATNEFNGGYSNPYVLRQDGVLSLCSMKGLVWFVPEQVHPQLPDQPIYIDQVWVNNRDTSFAGSLQLPNGYSRLTVGITTPFYGNKKNLYMEYKLNVDERWLPAGDDKIELNRLPAGNYELSIRKNGSFGSGYEYAYFKFEVLPAWHQTWWFRLLAVLVSIGLIMLGLRLRLNALLQRRKELEQQVESRTAELMQSNKMKESLISMVLHDLRSPIRFMNTVINYLADNSGRMNEQDVKEGVDELKRSSASLNEFTDHFFTWISSQNEHFTIKKTVFPMKEIFDDIKDLYNELLIKRENSCIISGGDVYISTDKNVLRSVVRNLVDNANKHTQKGTISMSAAKEGDAVVITISDTGSGMSARMVQSLQRSELSVNESQHGFRMVNELLEKLKGTLRLESTEGKGTAVHITISS